MIAHKIVTSRDGCWGKKDHNDGIVDFFPRGDRGLISDIMFGFRHCLLG
jgi:hypothetical protein